MPFAAIADDSVGRPSTDGSSIVWSVTLNEYEFISLRVNGPDGEPYAFGFKYGVNPMLHVKDLGEILDGDYTYELVVTPVISEDLKRKLKEIRAANNDSAARKLMREAGLSQTTVQSGGFVIQKGSIVAMDADERDANAQKSEGAAARGSGIGTDAARPGRITANDQVIPDDLIVQGSACIGFDCVNGESFGFDTIRLKENNLRIKFEDTSTLAGFPSTDWQLIANDSASGGLNKFVVEDFTAARQPLVIEGSATTNSVYVDSTGRVGFRTSTPVLDIHINTSNTPGIRLEQNNSGGFSSQTWDIAGNEANFFIRDVTGGSTLPFRIRPGAPTSSIDINADGDVGIGTTSPDYRLNVVATDALDNTLIQIENNGPARMRMLNTSTGETWNLGHQSPSGTGLVFSDAGDGTSEMILDVSGNMEIAGTLTQNSSRALKTEFGNIDPAAALAGVRSMPILTWVYKHDEKSARHIGPMAEDFHAAFALGVDNKHIAPSDQSGVALAAIQELANQIQRFQELNEQKDEQIRLLSARLAELEEKLKEQ